MAQAPSKGFLTTYRDLKTVEGEPVSYDQGTGHVTINGNLAPDTFMEMVVRIQRAMLRDKHVSKPKGRSEYAALQMTGTQIEEKAENIAWEQLRMFYKDKHGDDEQAYLASVERIQALRVELDS